MANLVTAELKSDLLRLYKISGDLLNAVETEFSQNTGDASKRILESLRSGLMDIGGTLQKDIYNCDYIETQLKVNENWSQT